MRSVLLVVLSAGCLSEPPHPECTLAEPIAELNSVEVDTSPWLSDDRLEIFFASDREGNKLRLYHAYREAHDGPFGAPIALQITTPGEASDPFLETDGLTLWFSSQEPLASERSIYVAQRPTVDSSMFGAATPVSGLGIASAHPSLTRDGRTLYYGGKTAGSYYAVMRATRPTKNAPFGPPMELEGIAPPTLPHTRNPSIIAGEDVLLFTADDGMGGAQRIYESDLEGDTFAPGAQNNETYAGNNTDSDTTASWHRGGETIVFASDRLPDPTRMDLYIVCK